MRLLPSAIAVWIAGGLLAVLTSQVATADDRKSDDDETEQAEIDLLGLAARMLHDGHHRRALTVLKDVNLNDPELDVARFYTLRGLAYAELHDFPKARADFEKAIAKGQKDPAVNVYLAQACFSQKDYKCTLAAIARAGSKGRDSAGVLLMKAEAAWSVGRKGDSLAALELGEKRFAANPEFQRLQIFHLIELGLYQTAISVSDRYVARTEAKAEDYVAVAEALRGARQFKRAQLLMEAAKLRFPEDENVTVQLAHCYLEDGKKFASAMLFEDAARRNEKYTLEAAELYKEAGVLYRASWLNGRVSDQTAKSKQRLSLLLESEDFEGITAMVGKLTRLGLMKDEPVRYAVAYAYYKTSRFADAESQLKGLTDPQLFESALQLRKAIAGCREVGWECVP